MGVFYLLTGLFVVLKGKNDSLSNTFILFTLLFSTSIFGFYEIDFLQFFSTSFAQMCYAFTVAVLVHLGLVLAKNTINEKNYKIAIRYNMIIAWLVSLPYALSTYFLQKNLDFNMLQVHHILNTIFVYYLASGFLLFAYLIYRTHSKSSEKSLEKFQSRIIFTGSMFSFTPYIFTWLVPLTFGYSASYHLGVVSFILFPFFLNYSILRYKTFDIEFFIRKGLIYASLSMFLTLSYISFSAFIFFVTSSFITLNSEIYIAVSAILATIITGHFKESVQNFIDKSFYRQKYNLSETLEKFVNEVNNVFDIRDLINTTFNYINNTFSPKSIALYSINGQQFNLLDSSGSFFPQTLSSNEPEKELVNIFENNDEAVVLTLKKDKDTIGIFYLSEKMSEVEYLIDEKNFLKNFASAFSMALGSIILKNESVELAEKNAELEKKASFLNSLVGNLSHDLKYPITSGVMSINAMKFRMLKNKPLDNIFINLQIEKIAKAFKKINEYAETFIDHELYSLNRLEIKSQEVNVNEVVNEALFLQSDYIESKNVSIELKLPDKEVFIKGDTARFERTILNLISNAVKYGRDKIKINVEIKDNNILIYVKDNGSGISEKVIGSIFERYSCDKKQNESSKERSTGLGLFICKTYINMMRGIIYFETEKGKGTTFYIQLPLLKVKEEKSIDYESSASPQGKNLYPESLDDAIYR